MYIVTTKTRLAAASAGYMKACVFSTGMAGARLLKDQLVVAQSQRMVREAQTRLDSEGPHVSSTSRSGWLPDLAIEVVAAMAAAHHGYGRSDKWALLERLYLAERVEAKIQRKGAKESDHGAFGALTRDRDEVRWHTTLLLCVQGAPEASQRCCRLPSTCVREALRTRVSLSARTGRHECFQMLPYSLLASAHSEASSASLVSDRQVSSRVERPPSADVPPGGTGSKGVLDLFHPCRCPGRLCLSCSAVPR